MFVPRIRLVRAAGRVALESAPGLGGGEHRSAAAAGGAPLKNSGQHQQNQAVRDAWKSFHQRPIQSPGKGRRGAYLHSSMVYKT